VFICSRKKNNKNEKDEAKKGGIYIPCKMMKAFENQFKKP